MIYFKANHGRWVRGRRSAPGAEHAGLLQEEDPPKELSVFCGGAKRRLRSQRSWFLSEPSISNDSDPFETKFTGESGGSWLNLPQRTQRIRSTA